MRKRADGRAPQDEVIATRASLRGADGVGRPAGQDDATRGKCPAGQSLRTQECGGPENSRKANGVPRARRAPELQTRSAQHD